MNRTIFVLLAVLLAVAAISLVTFYGNRPGPVSTFEMRPDSQTLLFGVTPWGESVSMREAYQPLLRHLSEKTGRKFQLLIIEDYDSAIENIADGSIDIANLPPVSFVTARAREPRLQYISTILREQGGRRFASYRGYIVAQRARFEGWGFDDFLKDAERYHFGFVTKKSSSGWAYPMAMMRKRGVDPFKEFKKVTIFENHPSVTDAIISGEIDLGATWEYNLEEAVKKHGDLFTVVYTSPAIPGLVWLASPKVETDLVRRIQSLLLEITASDDLRMSLLKSTPDKGWEVLEEGAYREVEEVLKYVGSFE